jgi:hypothetical protein
LQLGEKNGDAIMRFVLLPFILFLLSGCWLQYEDLPEVVVIGSENTLKNITSEFVMLRTVSYADKQETVKSAHIFVGETWSVQAMKYPDAWFYYYELENSCNILPQGQDITARYEMYDASGTVVQEDSVVLNISSCH